MLEVDLLGPVEVRISGSAVSLSPLERNLVALLALAKGSVVSTGKIIDCMWGERHPASPKSRVQGLISSLRRKIGEALVTRHPGYLLDPAACTVDIDRCQELARQARLAKPHPEIARFLRQALAVWRGEALDGVDAPGIDADRVRLGELRVALLEERFTAELDAGNHAEVVGEIAAVIAEHPLRERLTGQLMVALYRCHRQADALKAYEALRKRLAEELGSDPCADLRNIHACILRGEDSVPGAETSGTKGLSFVTRRADDTRHADSPGRADDTSRADSSPSRVDASPSRVDASPRRHNRAELERNARLEDNARLQDEPRLEDRRRREEIGHERRNRLKPAQLPPSVGHFTGRDRELAGLTAAVEARHDEPQVIFVSGAGGLGKTALVVRWAHLVASRFPDGQIFVDLHEDQTTPQQALAAVLATLGIAGERLPSSMDDRAALLRTLLSGGRVLVIADNADSVEQILPLVPPEPASQLVAISRRRMPALAAHHAVLSFPLGPLGSQATYDLLARIVGQQRLRDPAVARVIHWCGGWPLAIRLAAALLAERPGQSLASFADELDDYGNGPVLDGDPRSVDAALTGAYRALSPAAAHLFAQLGRNSQPLVKLRHTAAEPQLQRTRRLFDELVTANLIVEAGADCYQFHEIVHRFARRCGDELSAWRIPIESEVDSQRSL
jgi:DNA-binding SARP family transcriptional activator